MLSGNISLGCCQQQSGAAAAEDLLAVALAAAPAELLAAVNYLQKYVPSVFVLLVTASAE